MCLDFNQMRNFIANHALMFVQFFYPQSFAQILWRTNAKPPIPIVLRMMMASKVASWRMS